MKIKKTVFMLTAAMSFYMLLGPTRADDKAAQAKFQSQIAALQRSRWVYGGRNLFGDYFETRLVVEGGKLVWIGSKGTRVVYGVIPPTFQLDGDPEVIRRNWPLMASAKFKFAADFQSISETEIMKDGTVNELIYYRR